MKLFYQKISLFILINFFFLAYAQEKPIYKLSINEAIDFALLNNISTKKAKLDRESAFQKLNEVRSQGLPQINGKIEYNYYIKQPVTVLPATFEDENADPDEFVEAIFGAKQNMTAGVTLTQLIFSGTYLVAIKSAVAYERSYELLEEKVKSELKSKVVEVYGTALVAQKNQEIAKNNLELAKKNFDEASKTYEAGLIEKQNVEQMELSLKELESMLNTANRTLELSMLSTKFLLGLDLDSDLHLTTSFDDLVAPDFLITDDQNTDYQIEEIVDYKISQNDKRIAELNLIYEKSRALPSMGVFASYNYQRFSDVFPLFYSSETSWNPLSLVGFQIDIPIFGSFGLKAVVKQAKNNLAIAEMQAEENKKSLVLDIKNKDLKYKNAVDNFLLAKDRLALSESIYKKEQIKFSEGISTSNELRTTERQKYEADANFINTSLEVIKTKNELLKTSGKY